ncbi:MAG: hypothetical protein ACSHX3_16310 [Litorimonas sp.]
MAEDIMKTADLSEAASDELSADLREVRGAVQELGKLLKKLGKKRLDVVGEELEEQSENLMRQGRHAMDVLEKRVAQLEKNIESSVREHPGAWAGGLLGVIGFSLILGMLARRNH